MVHNRLNTRETHPNPHISFITALALPGAAPPHAAEDARQLLRALAAQVRPIMQTHGFAVNSLEEYEYNRVFAGRNWNAGEVVELVLRRADGAFVPVPWLMSTFCHELAHIKHMNHGPAFQKLWAQLRREVQALQNKGYYGDGYWSGGTRLADSAHVGGQGVGAYDLPEYICGGAHARERPAALARRRRRQPRAAAGPSNRTGAQTQKRRRPGSRVTARDAFGGGGRALNEEADDDEAKARGAGFRKQAGSKRAREERALAAEKRLRALQGIEDTRKSEPPASDEDEDDEDEDADFAEANADPETDDARRQTMRDVVHDDELSGMRDFMRDFLAEREPGERPSGAEGAGSSAAGAVASAARERPAKRQRVEPPRSMPEPGSSREPERTRTTARAGGVGKMVEDEMTTRRRESLGLTGGRKLESRAGPSSSSEAHRTKSRAQRVVGPDDVIKDAGIGEAAEWTCLVCTLENPPSYLACAACNTTRGEAAWKGEAA